MNPKVKLYLKDTAITAVILAASFFISIVLHNVFNIWEQITTLFVFAVFLISLLTDGYVFGIVSAFAAALIINYAFTDPYFHVDFSATVSAVSAVVMVILSFLTSALTTKLKIWQAAKSEAEMEKMRANLLRAVSHDLRTPLTTIYGASSSIIENYDKLNDVQKLQMVRGINEDSEWLIRMVENLLSVTRIDSGKVKIIKSSTVLEELIDSVILKFKKRYPDVPVSIDIPDELIIIPMDVLLIEQVIVNILENSVHHGIGFSALSLRVFTRGGKAVFELSDDGCGIPKEKLSGIFRGCGNMSTPGADAGKRNAGIGLSVCATIVKAHGGTITAENAKSGGAVFRFTLDTEAAE